MQLGALQIFSWLKMKASGTIRVVINTMSVHREGVEPNSVDGPDHHHDHIAQEIYWIMDRTGDNSQCV